MPERTVGFRRHRDSSLTLAELVAASEEKKMLSRSNACNQIAEPHTTDRIGRHKARELPAHHSARKLVRLLLGRAGGGKPASGTNHIIAGQSFRVLRLENLLSK
jgi:hypothetical protein